MKIYTVFGKDIVCPFLGWADVPDFECISDDEKDTINIYSKMIEEDILEDRSPAKHFHELSQYMQESEDKQLRALGSQLGLTADLMRKYDFKDRL